MSQYYYFVASLPMLALDIKPPLSLNDFLQSCERLLSPEDDARIRVAEFAAGFKQNFRVRQHRHQLFPMLRLVRLPVFVAAPGPGRRAKTRRMRHQMFERDLAHIAVRVMDGAECREVFDDRVVEFEKAAITQLHNGNAGEGLRDRSPVIDGAFVNRLLFLLIGEAEEFLRDDLAVLKEHKAAADDAVLAH